MGVGTYRKAVHRQKHVDGWTGMGVDERGTSCVEADGDTGCVCMCACAPVTVDVSG